MGLAGNDELCEAEIQPYSCETRGLHYGFADESDLDFAKLDDVAIGKRHSINLDAINVGPVGAAQI